MSPIPDQPHLPADNAEFFADPAMVRAAIESIEAERQLSFAQAFKRYWKAALWSMLLSFALVMEGYDVGMINSFFGQTSFKTQFGSTTADGTLYIPANWQSAINNAATIGQVIGLSINGWSQPRYGSKPTYICGMVAMIAAIFIPVFSKSLPVLFAGELISGIPWGIFQTLSVAYASEICPVSMRGYLSSFVNMCWGFGLFLAAGIVRASLRLDSQWGWRMPFMIQWVWPVPLAIGAFFAPESPWFLLRKGKTEEARRSLKRLARDGHYTEETLDQTIALMTHTDAMEKAQMQGGGFRECFRGSNLRRTEISCMVWIIQFCCGQPICGYATQFLESAGMTEVAAFDLNLSINSMYIIGTLCSWACMSRFGRRTIYLAGSVVLGLLLLVIGITGFFVDSHPNAAYGVGACMIVIQFAYNVTIGPGCYAIIAEIPATRVRSQTIVLGRTAYLISQVVVNQLVPRMLSVDAWNWGARCGLFWFGTNALSFVYTYFRLPETRGRTYGELDVLFFQKTPARRFASTKVNEFDDRAHDLAVDADSKDHKQLDIEHSEQKIGPHDRL